MYIFSPSFSNVIERGIADDVFKLSDRENVDFASLAPDVYWSSMKKKTLLCTSPSDKNFYSEKTILMIFFKN